MRKKVNGEVDIVIKEIDVDFFSMFLANRLEQAKEELVAMASIETPLGKWCQQRGIKLTQTVLTNSKQQITKLVLYATMSDVQVTEYALRF